QTPIRDYGSSFTITPQDPTGITVLETTMNLTVGTTPQRIKPTIEPSNTVLTDSVVTYVSSNPEIATVSHNGIVTAKSAGTTTIRATVKGGHSATITVNVSSSVMPEDLSVINVTDGNVAVEDQAEITMDIFSKKSFAAKLTGSPTDPSVIYHSDNPEVVSFLGDTWETEDGVM